MSKINYDYCLVDCCNLAYRNWWFNRELKTSKGVHSGLEYGFLQGIMKIIRTWQPAKLVLVWDGEPKRCLDLFPIVKNEETGELTGYKANRKQLKEKEGEPDWTPRLKTLRESLVPLVHTLYHPEAEADEEIASFVNYVERFSKRTLIFSSDQDLHQLVSEYTHILRDSKNKSDSDLVWGVDSIRDTWGVSPFQIPFRRAIEGDVSDGINGIPRIPKTTILSLVSRCSTIDDLLSTIDDSSVFPTESQKEKIQAGKSIIERNFKIMDLRSQIYAPTVIDGTIGDSGPAKNFCRGLEMNSVLDRKEWVLMERYGCSQLY